MQKTLAASDFGLITDQRPYKCERSKLSIGAKSATSVGGTNRWNHILIIQLMIDVLFTKEAINFYIKDSSVSIGHFDKLLKSKVY